jgi:hypothetical protein
MKTELIRIWGSQLATPGIEVYTEQAFNEKTSYISREFEDWRNLFHAQTEACQDILEAEGYKLAEALVQNQSQTRFSLPDEIILPLSISSSETNQSLQIPPALKAQRVGGLMKRLARKKLIGMLNHKLEELESNLDPSIATCAGLIRYATAMHLVHQILPAGNRVVYLTAPGDEIPTIPVLNNDEISHVSPAIRCFFLPQLVSFDNQDGLIANSIQDAEISLDTMQRFSRVLYLALSLAPYIIADPEYQEKRYGILGQLVNQGRAMARFENKEIIQVIQQRVRTNKLNRGLSLNIMYFDDQRLEIMSRRLQVIPAGRIIFHPSFVVLAARLERAKVAQDFRFNYSTRKHLQAELMNLEHAFEISKSQNDKLVLY